MTLPQGYMPGSELAVWLDDEDREVMVTVPQGVAPGQPMIVDVPPGPPGSGAGPYGGGAPAAYMGGQAARYAAGQGARFGGGGVGVGRVGVGQGGARYGGRRARVRSPCRARGRVW